MRSFYSSLLPLGILIVPGFASSLYQTLPNGISSLVQRDGNASWLLPVPTQDPWYKPPIDWEAKSPGTALSVRYSPYRNISIGNCLDTFQVLYRTTDSNNNASWAVTTVFIPASHANCSATHPENCSNGIITYEVPYDSADPDATPSYLLQYGEPYGEIYELMNHGWFVNAPDYEGPLASYCDGVQAGHATLDSVRALLQVAGDFGLTSNVRTALWGYSGGAMASAFAAELASAYAPDLKLAGVVQGGLIPNVSSAGNKMTSKDTAGLAIAGIIGITSQKTEARNYLNSRLKDSGPYNSTRFYTATNMSGAQVLDGFENQNIYDYFYNGSIDLANPILVDLYDNDAVMGRHGVPNMPVFIYKAIADEMSAASETDALVDSYCKQGANILYHRNDVGGHNEELWQGRARALAYLSAVLDGTDGISYPKTGCQTVNLTAAVNVTLVDGTAIEGPVVKDYVAIVVNPINVTVLANGSVLVPTDNGTIIMISPPASSKRSEHLGFSSLTKMWRFSTKSKYKRHEAGAQRLADAQNSLDGLGALQGLASKGWFTTLDTGMN